MSEKAHKTKRFLTDVGDETLAPIAQGTNGYLATLNAEQLRAVEYGCGSPQPRPLLIIAGAGTGKTNTLANRLAHLVINGADPRRILLLTFSRRAAIEMQRRVQRIAAQALGSNVRVISDALSWSGTFHAIGARLLREHAIDIGLEPAFTIQDREDSADLINLVRHELGFSKTAKRFPMKATCLSVYSRVVNAQAALGEILRSAFPWCVEWEAELRSLFAAYVDAKQRQNVLDYDDLLLYWAQTMKEGAVATEIAARFDYVLVDEYQDTNQLQASILMGLKPEGHGLTVVGDDAQAIYSFRAATVRNILEFPDQYKPRAEIITLERNYRSTDTILAAANAVIDLAPERFTKNLWSERVSKELPQLITVADDKAQASYIVERILEDREEGISLKSQAVLFRASHHSGALEIELSRRNIPFVKFGGLKFLEAAHVKDVMAFLRWAENFRDRVSAFRVVQLMPGIGPAFAGRLIGRMAETLDPVALMNDIKPPAGATEAWPELVEAFSRIREKSDGWPAELEIVCRWYLPHLERMYEDFTARRGDLDQLVQIGSTYPSRERFLTDLTLDPPSATSDEAGVPLLDEDYLILSTIHSAKGQEWTSVFLLNVVDGCIPSDLATGTTPEIDEERRLLYVAMTRAKDHLRLIVPQRFYTHGQHGQGDRHVYALRSRFIPNSIIRYFGRVVWPSAKEGTTSQFKTAQAPVDVRRRMREMWQR